MVRFFEGSLTGGRYKLGYRRYLPSRFILPGKDCKKSPGVAKRKLPSRVIAALQAGAKNIIALAAKSPLPEERKMRVLPKARGLEKDVGQTRSIRNLPEEELPRIGKLLRRQEAIYLDMVKAMGPGVFVCFTGILTKDPLGPFNDLRGKGNLALRLSRLWGLRATDEALHLNLAHAPLQSPFWKRTSLLTEKLVNLESYGKY